MLKKLKEIAHEHIEHSRVYIHLFAALCLCVCVCTVDKVAAASAIKQIFVSLFLSSQSICGPSSGHSSRSSNPSTTLCVSKYSHSSQGTRAVTTAFNYFELLSIFLFLSEVGYPYINMHINIFATISICIFSILGSVS